MIFHEVVLTDTEVLTLSNPTEVPIQVKKLNDDNVWEVVGALSVANPSITLEAGTYAVTGTCQGVSFEFTQGVPVVEGAPILAADVVAEPAYVVNTVVGLQSVPEGAKTAHIYVWGATDVVYTTDGAVPALNTGDLVAQYGTIDLVSPEELAAFKFLAAADPLLYITYTT